MCVIVSLGSVILVGQGPDTTFKEGATIVRYKVYDLARNRAGCKFIVRVQGKALILHNIFTFLLRNLSSLS